MRLAQNQLDSSRLAVNLSLLRDHPRRSIVIRVVSMLTRKGEMNHEMREDSEQYGGIENDYNNDNDNEEKEID